MSLYRATIRQSFSGIVVDNVIGLKGPDPSDPTEAQTLAENVWTCWNNDIKVHQASVVDLLGVDVIALGNPVIFGTASGTANSGRSSSPLPSWVCVSVDTLTGLRGRGYRGRLGICGVTESDTATTDGNSLTTANTAAWQTQVTSFYEDLNALVPASSGMVVISKTLHNAPRLPPIGTDVTSMHVHSRLGSRITRKR